MTIGKSPLEIYLAEIAEIRATGAGTKETSYAAILLISEKLDTNYRACRDQAFIWKLSA